MQRVREWARAVKRDVLVVYLVARDSRVPWPVKVLAAAVAAYALSPIDLIPDFIPILGYLDELILLPVGIWVVVKLIPANVMAEHRATATLAAERPVSRTAALTIALIWVTSIAMLIWLGYRYFSG